MTPAKALTALRQLACLGLPGKAVAPDLLELLRQVVGFNTAAIFYLDTDCRLTDVYEPFKFPHSVISDYLENFHNRPDGDGVTGMTLSQAMKSSLPAVLTSHAVNRSVLVKTEFFNRIMQPMDMGWGIQLPLRCAGRPVAVVILSRPFGYGDFSRVEVQLLAQAQRWLSHAISLDPSVSGDAVEPTLRSDHSGVLLLDLHGQFLSCSPGAMTLLHHAAGVPLARPRLRLDLPADGKGLLHMLTDAARSATAGKAGPLPEAFIRNDYGVFHLRAYAMETSTAGTQGHVSVHIERHVPVTVRLFQSSQFLSLSNRARDICLLLVQGQPNTDIASRLNLRPSTVASTMKDIYVSLNVHSRQELQDTLLKRH